MFSAPQPRCFSTAPANSGRAIRFAGCASSRGGRTGFLARGLGADLLPPHQHPAGCSPGADRGCLQRTTLIRAEFLGQVVVLRGASSL
jgi:hypothetical protein